MENGRYIFTFLNFKYTQVIILSIELNDNFSELEDSIGEVVTIISELGRQVMLRASACRSIHARSPEFTP